MSKLTHILPFMESEELKELALKIVNEEVKGVKLLHLFPFLSNEDLDEVVELLIEKGQGKQLTYVLPFVSKKTLNKIYEGIQEGKITGVKEQVMYPFLGKDKLKSMFNNLVEKATKEAEQEEKENTEE